MGSSLICSNMFNLAFEFLTGIKVSARYMRNTGKSHAQALWNSLLDKSEKSSNTFTQN
jgi:hypothetical protein